MGEEAPLLFLTCRVVFRGCALPLPPLEVDNELALVTLRRMESLPLPRLLAL